MAFSTYADAKTDANLVYYDALNGSTSGTWTGTEAYDSDGPFSQQWAAFNGSSSINFGSNDIPTDYTVSFWARLDADPTGGGDLRLWNPRQNSGLGGSVFIIDGSPYVIRGAASVAPSFVDASGATYPITTMRHIVFRNDVSGTGETTIWVDGVKVDTGTANDCSVAGVVSVIGAKNTAATVEAITGNIGEIFYFDRAISDAEIPILYAGDTAEVSVLHPQFSGYTEDYTATVTIDLTGVFADATGYTVTGNTQSGTVSTNIDGDNLEVTFSANENTLAYITVQATDGSNTEDVTGQVLLHADKSKPVSPLATTASGWTDITSWLQSTSRLVYVDATNGNDSTAGPSGDASDDYVYGTWSGGSDPRDPSITPNAFATIAAAKARLRDGQADWLLLKCGEEWSEAFGELSFSGTSPTARIVITSYDTGVRPKLNTPHTGGDSNTFQIYQTKGSNVAVVGIHCYHGYRDPDAVEYDSGALSDTACGLRGITYSRSDVLLEDMLFEHCSQGFQFQNGTSNIVVRRCVTIDCTSSGTFNANCSEYIVEQCIFDHNGWLIDRDDATFGAGPLKHNIYMQGDVNVLVKNICMVNNITARASCLGMHARGAGLVVNNLGIKNPVHFQTGGYSNLSNEQTGGFQATVAHNVAMKGDLISASDGGRGQAYFLRNTRDVDFFGNIACDSDYFHASNQKALIIQDASVRASIGVNITGNIVHDWKRGYPVDDSASGAIDTDSGNYWWDEDGDAAGDGYTFPGASNVDSSTTSWVDATRNIASYQSQLSATATVDAFLDTCRQQSAQNWDANYTAHAVNTYIREGFTVMGDPDPPISGVSLGIGADSKDQPLDILNIRKVPGEPYIYFQFGTSAYDSVQATAGVKLLLVDDPSDDPPGAPSLTFRSRRQLRRKGYGIL